MLFSVANYVFSRKLGTKSITRELLYVNKVNPSAEELNYRKEKRKTKLQHPCAPVPPFLGTWATCRAVPDCVRSKLPDKKSIVQRARAKLPRHSKLTVDAMQTELPNKWHNYFGTIIKSKYLINQEKIGIIRRQISI